MSKNLILGVVAALILGAGGYFLLAGDDDTPSNSDQSANQTEDSQAAAENGSFTPTTGLAFTADIKTTDSNGDVTNGVLKYNGTESWSWSSDASGETAEIRVVDGTFYTYDADSKTWISFGSTNPVGTFDTSVYDYDGDELQNFKSQATSLGQQPCPAGTCEAWRAMNYEGNESFTMWFADNGQISQVSGVSNDGTEVMISYTYGNVEVNKPPNAQSFEIPS